MSAERNFDDAILESTMKAVARKLKFYIDVQRREEGFDLSGSRNLHGQGSHRGLGGSFHNSCIRHTLLQRYLENPVVKNKYIGATYKDLLSKMNPREASFLLSRPQRERSAFMGNHQIQRLQQHIENSILMETTAQLLMSRSASSKIFEEDMRKLLYDKARSRDPSYNDMRSECPTSTSKQKSHQQGSSPYIITPEISLEKNTRKKKDHSPDSSLSDDNSPSQYDVHKNQSQYDQFHSYSSRVSLRKKVFPPSPKGADPVEVRGIYTKGSRPFTPKDSHPGTRPLTPKGTSLSRGYHPFTPKGTLPFTHMETCPFLPKDIFPSTERETHPVTLKDTHSFRPASTHSLKPKPPTERGTRPLIHSFTPKGSRPLTPKALTSESNFPPTERRTRPTTARGTRRPFPPKGPRPLSSVGVRPFRSVFVPSLSPSPARKISSAVHSVQDYSNLDLPVQPNSSGSSYSTVLLSTNRSASSQIDRSNSNSPVQAVPYNLEAGMTPYIYYPLSKDNLIASGLHNTLPSGLTTLTSGRTSAVNNQGVKALSVKSAGTQLADSSTQTWAVDAETQTEKSTIRKLSHQKSTDKKILPVKPSSAAPRKSQSVAPRLSQSAAPRLSQEGAAGKEKSDDKGKPILIDIEGTSEAELTEVGIMPQEASTPVLDSTSSSSTKENLRKDSFNRSSIGQASLTEGISTFVEPSSSTKEDLRKDSFDPFPRGLASPTEEISRPFSENLRKDSSNSEGPLTKGISTLVEPSSSTKEDLRKDSSDPFFGGSAKENLRKDSSNSEGPAALTERISTLVEPSSSTKEDLRKDSFDPFSGKPASLEKEISGLSSPKENLCKDSSNSEGPALLTEGISTFVEPSSSTKEDLHKDSFSGGSASPIARLSSSTKEDLRRDSHLSSSSLTSSREALPIKKSFSSQSSVTQENFESDSCQRRYSATSVCPITLSPSTLTEILPPVGTVWSKQSLPPIGTVICATPDVRGSQSSLISMATIQEVDLSKKEPQPVGTVSPIASTGTGLQGNPPSPPLRRSSQLIGPVEDYACSSSPREMETSQLIGPVEDHAGSSSPRYSQEMETSQLIGPVEDHAGSSSPRCSQEMETSQLIGPVEDHAGSSSPRCSQEMETSQLIGPVEDHAGSSSSRCSQEMETSQLIGPVEDHAGSSSPRCSQEMETSQLIEDNATAGPQAAPPSPPSPQEASSISTILLQGEAVQSRTNVQPFGSSTSIGSTIGPLKKEMFNSKTSLQNVPSMEIQDAHSHCSCIESPPSISSDSSSQNIPSSIASLRNAPDMSNLPVQKTSSHRSSVASLRNAPDVSSQDNLPVQKTPSHRSSVASLRNAPDVSSQDNLPVQKTPSHRSSVASLRNAPDVSSQDNLPVQKTPSHRSSVASLRNAPDVSNPDNLPVQKTPSHRSSIASFKNAPTIQCVPDPPAPEPPTSLQNAPSIESPPKTVVMSSELLQLGSEVEEITGSISNPSVYTPTQNETVQSMQPRPGYSSSPASGSVVSFNADLSKNDQEYDEELNPDNSPPKIVNISCSSDSVKGPGSYHNANSTASLELPTKGHKSRIKSIPASETQSEIDVISNYTVSDAEMESDSIFFSDDNMISDTEF